GEGRVRGASAGAPVFLIGSHLDSVPDAGKYDGVLGVLLGVAAVQALDGKHLPFAVDILGFCEEEGVRFRTPYLGSLAVCGRFDPALLERTDATGISLAAALRDFGLDPVRFPDAAYPASQVLGYLEAHIEQGPVLDTRNLPLGVVEAIVGQSRLWLRFEGKAGHAGTLPMELRQDALVAAAEFIVAVEYQAHSVDALRATVGTLAVAPGAVNVVPGTVKLSLDIRHPQDTVRERATAALLEQAAAIAGRRGVGAHVDQAEHHPAVPTDPWLTDLVAESARAAGSAPLRMVSGAGHDAAVMARLAPMTMLFVRSPGGVSHHPDEAVLLEDVRAALEVLVAILHRLAGDMV
ncbi:MAG: Zn-dependent hydrolase, partial [Gemmataceae bacterium]|nr:Zn-dependent hydrolase [Gemmataceae bacterium]